MERQGVLIEDMAYHLDYILLARVSSNKPHTLWHPGPCKLILSLLFLFSLHVCPHLRLPNQWLNGCFVKNNSSNNPLQKAALLQMSWSHKQEVTIGFNSTEHAVGSSSRDVS